MFVTWLEVLEVLESVAPSPPKQTVALRMLDGRGRRPSAVSSRPVS